MLLGSILAGAAFLAIGLGLARVAPLLLAVAAMMAIVGMMAALGPARRGLRIQAIEALRADAKVNWDQRFNPRSPSGDNA